MKLSSNVLSVAHYLARAAGLKSDVPAARDVNWDIWLKLVDENQVGPFLGSRQAPDWPIPSHVRAELTMRHVRAGSMAAVQCVELMRILNAFNGIVEIVVLKGAALIPVLYRETAERLMWDMDILLRTAEDRDKAGAILEELGYRPRKQLSHHHHLPAFHNPINGMVLELHTNLATPPLADGFMSEMWNMRRSADLPFPILDIPALLAHHCVHILNDPIESPLLRNLFEVGWIASRMTTAERHAFYELVTKWELAPRVAHALWLAAAIFGTPTLLDAPRRGAYEYWCERRLEWYEYKTLRARWNRHVAAAHIVKLLEGNSPNDPLVLPSVVIHSLSNALRNRILPRLAQPSSNPLRRRSMRAAVCGELVILYDNHSRQIHLLNPLATRIWHLADGCRPLPEIVEQLAQNGMDRHEVITAVRQLLKMGILER